MATKAEQSQSPPVINISSGASGSSDGWFSWMPTWKRTSEEMLMDSERLVLGSMQSDYKDLHIPVGPDTFIHTVVFEPTTPPEQPAIPLVMIHGFGCGIPQFYKNYDHLHDTRHVYSLDLPGYGRSTRVQFTDDAEENEKLFVTYLERWRSEVGLDKFILLGHSFGGFISAAYAIKYPDRVRHLVLNDPWGLPRYLEEMTSERGRRYPVWVSAIAMVVTKFNPFTPIRMAGPAGPYLMKRFRADLTSKFGDDFMNYVYHSNVQDPTGENAFFSMQFQYGWAIRPMLPRVISDLHTATPISLIYGEKSWMDSSTGERISRARSQSYVEVHRIKRAGHHIHAEQPEAFNRVVNHICAVIDSDGDSGPRPRPVVRLSRTDSFG